MTCGDVRPLLNAWLDNELNGGERSAIDSHIRTCPSCANELEQLERVRQTIRVDLHYHKAPDRLRSDVQFALRGATHLDTRAKRSNWTIWAGIAAAIVLCALISAPFLVNARNEQRLIAEELLSAHVRASMGRSVDVVSSDQHTVKPWFNGKLPFSPPVVDLAAEGFPLQGGRLDYVSEYPAAALVYGRRLHRIDVFVWPASGRKGPSSQFSRDGYHEISWTKDNFQFTAVSDLNAAELRTFVNLLQTK